MNHLVDHWIQSDTMKTPVNHKRAQGEKLWEKTKSVKGATHLINIWTRDQVNPALVCVLWQSLSTTNQLLCVKRIPFFFCRSLTLNKYLSGSITLSAVFLTVLMTLLAHGQLSSLLIHPGYLTTSLCAAALSHSDACRYSFHIHSSNHQPTVFIIRESTSIFQSNIRWFQLLQHGCFPAFLAFCGSKQHIFKLGYLCRTTSETLEGCDGHFYDILYTRHSCLVSLSISSLSFNIP